MKEIDQQALWLQGRNRSRFQISITSIFVCPSVMFVFTSYYSVCHLLCGSCCQD